MENIILEGEWHGRGLMFLEAHNLVLAFIVEKHCADRSTTRRASLPQTCKPPLSGARLRIPRRSCGPTFTCGYPDDIWGLPRWHTCSASFMKGDPEQEIYLEYLTTWLSRQLHVSRAKRETVIKENLPIYRNYPYSIPSQSVFAKLNDTHSYYYNAIIRFSMIKQTKLCYKWL